MAYHHWTLKEIEEIKKMMNTHTEAEIASRFGTSRENIHMLKRRYNLTKPKYRRNTYYENKTKLSLVAIDDETFQYNLNVLINDDVFRKRTSSI